MGTVTTVRSFSNAIERITEMKENAERNAKDQQASVRSRLAYSKAARELDTALHILSEVVIFDVDVDPEQVKLVGSVVKTLIRHLPNPNMPGVAKCGTKYVAIPWPLLGLKVCDYCRKGVDA